MRASKSCLTIFSSLKTTPHRLVNRYSLRSIGFDNWERVDSPAVLKDEDLESFDFCAWPADQNPDQEFELIGRMSQMVSRQFNERTTEAGVVDHLTPKSEPEQFGALIPPSFKGDVLGIWRFTQQPQSPTFSS